MNVLVGFSSRGAIVAHLWTSVSEASPPGVNWLSTVARSSCQTSLQGDFCRMWRNERTLLDLCHLSSERAVFAIAHGGLEPCY